MLVFALGLQMHQADP